jgi:hypothetical protein
LSTQSQSVKTCFVSAPSGLKLGTLRESLLAHGIRPLIPEELTAGTDWASEIQRQMLEADLVIGVLPGNKQAPSVLFELGQAWALRKRILLIASPKAEWLPFPLKRVLVLRVDVRNRQALDFALEQFLSAPTDREPERARVPFERKALGPQSDVLLERLEQWRDVGDARTLERIVSDALRDAGSDFVVESPEHERGADLAVWSDVLQPFVGNPLLVEVKSRVQDKASAKQAGEQLTVYLAESGARWGLLLYGDGPASTGPVWASTPPNVIALSVSELLEALRGRSFPEVIRDLRNERVHGVRP